MTSQVTTLNNGFRIVSENMPGLKSASVGIWVAAGGRHERLEQNGIAHFLEHMAFKGTKSRSALQIAEAIEDVGGYINAYTSREMTAYYVRVLGQDVPLGLDVISDILLNPTFEAAELETERGVILQEIGQALDTPDDVVFDWLQGATYPDQPIGRTILGPAENVSSFQSSDLSEFVSEHYGPENLILSAAGDVDHDALVKAAEALFGGLAKGARPAEAPASFIGGEHRVEKQLEQAHFAMCFDGPGYRNDDIYTSQILASALGGGMSSRLFQEVREKRGLCYTIFAQAGAFSDGGTTTIYAGTSGDQLAELACLAVDEVKRAADDMSEKEVARARAQMKAGMLMGLESPSSRAERLARLVSIWGRVPSLEETVEKVDAVTHMGVREMAAKMSADARISMATYGPKATSVSVQELRERLVG
ncbi:MULTISPECIES: M16 family metallopeptidase [Halocynthiibacter]|uniref:Insulinase family protein n=1 Tax=Halocynthiibacter halioticoli TaxID=2986804 RepID=A0AAE3J253_9RHOB|nr:MULTISPECIES: pitrilysin family protein [Halocynthiibacter]MCV6825248.1 insulinase family protein [Halocynthiibacter halioticoli]MCW4058249.1 insulinase family protein [Halocynthiibacter sp. SDUM655004]